MAKIKVEGLEELQKKLKNNVKLDAVKKTVRLNAAQMTNKMTKNADFTKGYATRTTKRSIPKSSPKFSDDGMSAEIGPETKYSEYLELGTRFMSPQPFILPAYAEQKKKFMNDMNKLFK